MYSHDNDEPGVADAQFAGRQKSVVDEWVKRVGDVCLTRMLSWSQPEARAAEILRTGRFAHRLVRMADIMLDEISPSIARTEQAFRQGEQAARPHLLLDTCRPINRPVEVSQRAA